MPQRVVRRISYGSFGKPFAFILMALVVGIVLTHIQNSNLNTIYHGQLEACERGNVLRTESNHRIQSHRADTKALSEFLARAEEARLGNYKESHLSTDLQAAHAYKKLRLSLKTVKFAPVSIIDCEKIVPKP